MNNVGNNIRKILLKRQEAISRHFARKEAFLNSKKQLIKDIEEAGNIWRKAMEQLPKQEF